MGQQAGRTAATSLRDHEKAVAMKSHSRGGGWRRDQAGLASRFSERPRGLRVPWSQGLLPSVFLGHNGVITHQDPDILECEVKWALGSITMNKASGGDGIPVELFQILKDNAVKVLHSICQQIWKTQQWPQDWKRSVFIPIPKKGSAKECSNYHTIALISHASKVMLKILQVKIKSLSCVQLLATPWTAAYQVPPSMRFSRQEYWSGVPLPSPPIR